MINLKTVAAAAVIAAGIGAAPAQAVSTTFAQFQTIGQGSNVYFKNNGANGSNGTGGSFYTIATGNGTTAGSRLTSFSFLQPQLASIVNNQNAVFTLFGTVTNTPAVLNSGFLIQQNIVGSFSFLSTQDITVGTTFYAAGSNLLSGTFSSASIFGQRLGSTASFTPGTGTVNFTSDFLSFDETVSSDFALSLNSITSVLQAAPSGVAPTRALRSFRGVAVGAFSSDPAPIVTGVPEPQMWGLMVAGFGLVGITMRRRSNKVATISA